MLIKTISWSIQYQSWCRVAIFIFDRMPICLGGFIAMLGYPHSKPNFWPGRTWCTSSTAGGPRELAEQLESTIPWDEMKSLEDPAMNCPTWAMHSSKPAVSYGKRCPFSSADPLTLQVSMAIFVYSRVYKTNHFGDWWIKSTLAILCYSKRTGWEIPEANSEVVAEKTIEVYI